MASTHTVTPSGLEAAVAVLRRGGLLAYPTEAVYGLGCDPDNATAVARLLALKQRKSGKGLILVAATVEQLTPYIAPLTDDIAARVLPTWPGPYTWLLPAATRAAPWLRGEHMTIAVRVSSHPVVKALCTAFGGALVSTSANPAGQPPALDAATVSAYFGTAIDLILPGALGGHARPSEIRDARSGAVIRQG